MPDQLTDHARKAAEEIQDYCDLSSHDCDRVADIIERHMREASKENLKEFLDFMLKTWNEVHKNYGTRFMNKKGATPCPKK